MTAKPHSVIVLFLLVLGAGCTADPLEPREAAGIETIQLVPPPEPRRYDANIFVAPGAGLRLGAYDAVLAGDIGREPEADDIDARLTWAIAEEAGLSLGAELADAVGKSLAASGYRVQHGDGAVDARLVMTLLFAGYVEQPFRPYTPLLLVDLELRGSSGERLFRQRYNYGAHPYLADDERMAPDRRFRFDDEAHLLADPAFTAEGLREAIPHIAADVPARLLHLLP